MVWYGMEVWLGMNIPGHSDIRGMVAVVMSR